jgi:hypothetical protein
MAIAIVRIGKIRRIYHHHARSHAASTLVRLTQGMGKKNVPEPPSLLLFGDSQAADARRTHERVSRDMFAGLFRHLPLAAGPSSERLRQDGVAQDSQRALPR